MYYINRNKYNKCSVGFVSVSANRKNGWSDWVQFFFWQIICQSKQKNLGNNLVF